MKFVLLLLTVAMTAQAAPVKVEVQLDWKANAQVAGLLVAKENGWYAEAGLDVTIHPNDFKRPYLDVVTASDCTIGVSEGRSLVAARGRGAPIRALATMFRASPIVLLSKSERGIHSVRDLTGKMVGLHRPEDVGMLNAIFAAAGMPVRNCEWKKVGFQLQELLADQVDAVQGYSVSELVELQQRGVEVNALRLADCGWIDYAQVFFTSEAFLKSNPEAISKFLSVSFRGWRAAVADPVETAAMLNAKYVPDQPAGFEEASLREIAPLLTRESPRMGTMRAETWAAIFAMFKTYHLGETPARVNDLVDFRFMPEL